MAARRWVGRVLVVLASAATTAGFVVVSAARHSPARDDVARPNIVVIMTDDQSLESMSAMPNTQAMLADRGTTFTTATTSFPNCCPSRATALTGLYAHNHGVLDNVAPHGGFHRFDARSSVVLALRESGYDTIHVGKYLNGWGSFGDIEPPMGWTSWYGLIGETTYQYYGFSVSDDGRRVDFPADERQYQTDALAAEVVREIDERGSDSPPFYLSFAPMGPHVSQREGPADEPLDRMGPIAPDRYADRDVPFQFVDDPSFDEEDVSDKPPEMQRDPLGEAGRSILEQWWQAEVGAVAAVDDAVGSILTALDRVPGGRPTLVIFTSDNGLMHGQHRFPVGKFVLYDPSVRVPLIVRGADFDPGAEVATPVSNVDLAPTIAAAAGVELPVEPDGLPLAAIARNRASTVDRAVLLENFRRGEPGSQGVRTLRWTYLEHADGTRELYDLVADPFQLENVADDPRAAESRTILAAILDDLRDCAGRACDVPIPASLG